MNIVTIRKTKGLACRVVAVIAAAILVCGVTARAGTLTAPNFGFSSSGAAGEIIESESNPFGINNVDPSHLKLTGNGSSTSSGGDGAFDFDFSGSVTSTSSDSFFLLYEFSFTLTGSGTVD